MCIPILITPMIITLHNKIPGLLEHNGVILGDTNGQNMVINVKQLKKLGIIIPRVHCVVS